MVYGENEGEVFLGRSVTTQKNVSESTMQKVDEEIRKIIDAQYAVARKLARGQSRQGRGDGQGAARDGDDRRRPDRRHHGGPAGASAASRRTGRPGPSSGGTSPTSGSGAVGESRIENSSRWKRRRARRAVFLRAMTRSSYLRSRTLLDLVAPARDGHPQRHAGLLLRRRPLPRSRARARPRAAAWSPTARTSSTSAANPRARAPRRCPRPTSSRACCRWSKRSPARARSSASTR